MIRTRSRLKFPGAFSTSAPNGLRFVANGCWFNSTNDTIAAAADQRRETRCPMFLGGQSVTEIRILYCNYWLDLGSSGRETNTGNAVDLDAAFEYSGITVRVTFGGQNTYTMADGEQLIISDPIYPAAFSLVSFPANANIFVRTGVQANIGQKLPRNFAYLSGSPGSKVQMTVGNSQLMSTGLMTGTLANGPGPIGLVGITSSPELSVLFLGDSTVVGNNDVTSDFYGASGGGYARRGMYQVNGRNIPMANHARNGGTIAQYQAYGNGRRKLYQYASHVMIGFGTNDLFAVAGITPISNFITAMTNEIALIKSSGVKNVYTLMPDPRTTSSDTWITESNQSQQVNWQPIDISNAMTQLKGLGDGYFDPSIDYRGIDQAKWVVNGTANYATNDGTHPSTALSILAGARLKTLAATWAP